MNPLRPADDCVPIPAGLLVFRISKNAVRSPVATDRRQALEMLFELSTEDKKSPGQRLSIWIERLTLPDQAWAFTGSSPEKTVVVCLNVDEIRAITPSGPFHPLDVEWERALHEDGTPNTLPGAEGHVGITGLNQGGKGKIDSSKRKALRSQLADLARVSPVPVPHDIPEDHIREAAYWIYRTGDPGNDSQHWIIATRQLRRARASG